MQTKVIQNVFSYFSLRPRTVHNTLKNALNLAKLTKFKFFTSTDPEIKKEQLFKNSTILGKIVMVSLMLAIVFVPFGSVHAAAYVTLSAFSGNATSVKVSGGGWSSGETVTIYLNNTSSASVASAVVAADSFFGPVSVSIPANTPEGALPIIAVGSVSSGAQSNSYYVVGFNPSISPASSPNTPGSSVQISGSGFAPNETVTFRINSSSLGSAVSNSSGGFEKGIFTVPFISSGTSQLRATGNSSGASALYYFYVGGFYPSAYPSVYFTLPSQPLSFSGSGFAANETVRVFLSSSSTPLSSFTTDSAGSFELAGSFSVPFNFAGSLRTFTLVGQVSHVSTSVNVTIGQFYPGVFPSAYYISPNQLLNFSGTGFAALENIKVYEGIKTTVLSSFNAAADGSFVNNGSLAVPFSFAGTPRLFRLVGSTSGAIAEVPVTIGQYYPQIFPSAYFINPGQSLVISGSGFAPNEIVDITLGGATPVSVTASGLGSFASGSITLPFTSLPMLSISALGESSHVTANVVVTMGTYYPTVSPSAYYIFPGSSLSFSGSGFAPGELVSVTSSTTTLGSVLANSFGNISSPFFTVPFGVSGNKVYMFRGALSNSTVSVSVTVAGLLANAEADSYYALPGSTIKVRGTGFAAGESVTVSGGSLPLTTTASSTGATVFVPVVLPFGTSPAVITLTGTLSGVSAFVPISLAPFSPQVSPSTYYTSPGTNVAFTGTGFASGESVSVSLNGVFTTSVSANSLGNINTSGILIPVSSANANFVFTGSLSKVATTVSVGLSSFSPQVSPSSWYVQAGSSLTFTGAGFASGESVSIKFNGSQVSTSTVNSEGGFTSSAIAVPYSAPSAHFEFTSSLTHAVLSVDVGIAALAPGIVLSSYYDIGGAPLTISGSGFGSSESVVVTFGGTSLATVNSNLSGSFTFVGNVPFGTAGNKTVQARGQSSFALSSASFTQPQIYVNTQLGAYAGAPSQPVTFIGSGFLPNEQIQITTNRTGSVVVHIFTTDSSGNFNNSSYVIPVSFVGGPLALTITGQHSFTPTSITYYVTGP